MRETDRQTEREREREREILLTGSKAGLAWQVGHQEREGAG